jgi:hypothetical protein
MALGLHVFKTVASGYSIPDTEASTVNYSHSKRAYLFRRLSNSFLGEKKSLFERFHNFSQEDV